METGAERKMCNYIFVCYLSTTDRLVNLLVPITVVFGAIHFNQYDPPSEKGQRVRQTGLKHPMKQPLHYCY